MAKARTNVEVRRQEEEGQGLIEVARPLSLSERAITLAAVISIDFDYFSRHSGSHGIGGHGGAPMPWFFPFPGIFGGGDEAGEGSQAGGGGGDGGGGDGGGGVAGDLGGEQVDEDTAGWLGDDWGFGGGDDDGDGGGFFDGDWD